MIPMPSNIKTHAPVDVHDSCNCRTVCCFFPRITHRKNCEHRVEKVAHKTFPRSEGNRDLKNII